MTPSFSGATNYNASAIKMRNFLEAQGLLRFGFSGDIMNSTCTTEDLRPCRKSQDNPLRKENITIVADVCLNSQVIGTMIMIMRKIQTAQLLVLECDITTMRVYNSVLSGNGEPE
ncbi:hypothetical protein ACJX0J_008069 [Zea mays]